MNVLHARNPHRALPYACELLAQSGVPRPTRYGDVLVVPDPVTTMYERPLERVVLHAERDANPFLHFADAMWVLGGRCDVEYLARFGARMRTFSDDGERFHGAYGLRLRHGFHDRHVSDKVSQRDQLAHAAFLLRENPNERRVVLQIWDGDSDLGRQSKDIPCNLTIKLAVSVDGELDMVVFNRSNDIVWGCYGANAVQFSYLQEYVALRAGYPVGRYWQISCDWHGYDATFRPLLEAFRTTGRTVYDPLSETCPYEQGLVAPYPLMQSGTDPDQWDRDLRRALTRDGRAPAEGRWHDPFFPEVFLPIIQTHDVYKDTSGEARYEASIRHTQKIQASDWRLACEEWLTRRWNAYRQAQDDGPSYEVP